jgi:hypothetical protein
MVRQACPEPDEGLTTTGLLFSPFALLLRLCPFVLSQSKGERLDSEHDGASKGERSFCYDLSGFACQ